MKRLPAFCPAAPDTSRCEPVTFSDSCQSSASFFDSSTTVTSISTSFCGTSSWAISRSYIGMRETTSRTSTALRRFSGRMTGRNTEFIAASSDACADSAALVAPASRVVASTPVDIISSISRATPLIVTVDSGEETLNETLSAHVLTSGKRRISTSLNVRICRSRSALAISSATSKT